MSVKVTEGVRWILPCTNNFDNTVAFFRDVLGLSVTDEGIPVTDTQFSRYALFEIPNDVVLEIVQPHEAVSELYTGPIMCLTVSDVAQARLEMERMHIEFVAPIFDTKQGWGWTYFRAPDDNVYQIQGPYEK